LREARARRLHPRLRPQRRDRAGRHQRHAAADGHGLRRDRQRRHALSPAGGAPHRTARGLRGQGVPPRGPQRGGGAARPPRSRARGLGDGDGVAGRHRLLAPHPGHAHRGKDRHRAGRADRRDPAEGGGDGLLHARPRLVRRLRSGGGAGGRGDRAQRARRLGQSQRCALRHAGAQALLPDPRGGPHRPARAADERAAAAGPGARGEGGMNLQFGIAGRSVWKRAPWGLIALAAGLFGVGIVNLASATRAEHTPLWLAQLVWVGGAYLTVLVLLKVDYERLYQLAWPFWGLVVFLLVAVEFRGEVAMGAQRWLVLGPLRVQPSELAKLSVILVLAKIYEDDGERPRGYGLLDLWKPLLVIGIPAGLTLIQPDLGTALLIAAIGGSLVLVAKVRRSALAVLGASGIVAGVLAWSFVLRDYQKRRVLAFLDPEADILGSGYHANQSMIAVGSGRWAGKGWGQGTQTQLSFLPEQHTDFVFSVFAEEWGFRGS